MNLATNVRERFQAFIKRHVVDQDPYDAVLDADYFENVAIMTYEAQNGQWVSVSDRFEVLVPYPPVRH